MKIKEEFKNLIPALSVEEFKQLEENCLAEGIRDAIITWHGYIIDGHNRYEIATKHELQYESIEKSFDSEDDVKEWMIHNQFGRRNLSNFQRSVLALELESVFSARAKERMLSGNPSQTFDKGRVDEKIGDIAKVSHETIRKVKVIQATATPEVKAKLSTGEVSINQVYQDIKKEEKKTERLNQIEEIKIKIEEENLTVENKKYHVIAIDPPWNYKEKGGFSSEDYDSKSNRGAVDYPTMNLEQIKKIELPEAEDCVFRRDVHRISADRHPDLPVCGAGPLSA